MLQLPRAATVPVLAVLLAAGAEECDVEGPPKACDFRPEVKIEERLVVGTATARCDVPPEEHDFELELQYGGPKFERWETQRTDKSRRIPRPGDPVTVTTRFMCLPGKWRAYASAVGVGPNGDTFAFSDFEVQEVTMDDCRR